MSRADALLRDLPRSARVIEIGPSYNGLVPKREGWNTTIIDHASRGDLVAKYAGNASVDTARIEEVDHVWQGGSLADLIPADLHGTYDAFVASHVIEHTTDVVSFLKAAETLIRPGGLVILAVPDKRKCFDFYRPVATTGEAIDAFLDRRSKHSRRTFLDFGCFAANKEGHPGWAIDDIRVTTFDGPVTHGPFLHQLSERPGYHDAHAWVFIPASFELMILELSHLGYLDLQVDAVEEQTYTEFFAWLRRGVNILPADELQAARLRLNQRVIVELAEQSRQIPGSPLHASTQATPPIPSGDGIVERLARLEAQVFGPK